MLSYLGITINAICILVLYGLVFYLINESIFVRNRMETNRRQMQNLIKDINYNDTSLHRSL